MPTLGRAFEWGKMVGLVDHLKSRGIGYPTYAAKHNEMFPKDINWNSMIANPKEVSCIAPSTRSYP